MQRDLRAMIDGGLAGTIATAPMSAVMLAAQGVDRLGFLPPRIVTEEALDALDVHGEEPAEEAVTLGLHFGFGLVAGALFGVLYRRLRPPVGAPAFGLLFGSLVWLVSYWGWVPALGIMPPPPRDRPGRPRYMLVAHWVFGWTMGLALDRRAGAADE